MNTKTTLTALALTTACFVTSFASADVIAKYDFNASSFVDSTSAPGLDAGDLTPGAQLALNDGFSTSYSTEGAASFFATYGALTTGETSTSIAWGVAATNGIYLEFTLTPDSGKSLNLVDLNLDVGRAPSDTGLRVAVTSSIAGHAYADRLEIVGDGGTLKDVLQSGTEFVVSPLLPDQNWGAGQDTVVNLSGASFQDISTPVTFRIYAFALGTTSSTNNTIRLDNVFVNGAVIPEPSTFALMAGFLGLAVVMLRRRR